MPCWARTLSVPMGWKHQQYELGVSPIQTQIIFLYEKEVHWIDGLWLFLATVDDGGISQIFQ